MNNKTIVKSPFKEFGRGKNESQGEDVWYRKSDKEKFINYQKINNGRIRASQKN